MEERALPLRNVSNDFSSFGPEAYPDGVVPPIAADDAASICASRSSSAAPTARGNAWVLAALNFNAKRERFAPFDESKDGKLGSVYTRLTETLLERGDWDRMPALRNKATGELKLPAAYGLLLGTAQGKGIPWGRLGYGVWPPPLVNYCRGFEMLTRKGKLAATLAQAAQESEGDWPAQMPEALRSAAAVVETCAEGVWELAPTSFVFHPSKGDNNPLEALRRAHASRAEAAASADPNLWILKPSEGAKGEGIFIEGDLSAIEAHLTKQHERAAEGEAVSSWVVQRYVHNPLLLEAGGRKFDMRCWVLVDAHYGVHLYRHGVLRVASASYDPSTTHDRFAHLTNHCIATEHAEYGKYEATNELFYAPFDRELSRRYPEHSARAAGTPLFGDAAGAPPSADGIVGGSVLETVVLPQIKRHVVQTMLAARERLQCDGEYYRPFQLYGYDFLVDADLHVWLCEINASPAVADELLPGLVKALIRTALDPICEPNAELIAEGKPAYDAAATAAVAKQEFFEELFAPPPPPKADP